MVQRVTYRRQNSYNTRSNRIKTVRTPGGKLVAHYISKKVRAPATQWDNGQRIGGLKRIRGTDLNRISKNQRTVNRPYGGTLTGSGLRDRILTAFINEEVKEVKIQLAQSAAEEKKKAPAAKKGKKTGASQASKQKK